MQSFASATLALLAWLAAATVCSAGVATKAAQQITPVQKVVQLMEGMLEKGKKEKKDEQVQFAAFKQFCEGTTAAKEAAIEEANDRIDSLKADIEKYITDAAGLAKEIKDHDADISAWTGDVKAATIVRELEKADYDKLHTDYSESVDALQRAIEVLKKQAYNRKQASFAQVASLNSLNLIPDEAKKAISAFLQQDPDVAAEGLEVSAPEAHGYEFQSKGVIEMLEKLLDKFINERTELEKTEMNTKSEYELLMQDLESSTAQAKLDREEKAVMKAKALQAKADSEGELVDVTTTRDADQKYHSDLVATCEEKATAFESRQTLRAEELEAIQKAIEIISSEAVTGNAEKHLAATDEELGKAAALATLRTFTSSENQGRVAEYLREQAQRLGSRVLAEVATHVESDPFRKVKKMIKDLITRLLEEANEEAEHKGWCDTELSTNEQTRKTKTQAVETLHAEIDQLETSTAKIMQDLAEIAEAIAELQKAMAEATELRAQEKEKNKQTIKDAQEAQTAVAQALVVLKEFYARAAEATALLQQPQPEAPPIFDEPYTGMGGESGGVIGMLEVIESDFARLEGDTSAAEEAAQKVKSEKQALVVKKADLEGTQKELNAALDYYDKLKPSCVDAGVSYESRVGRRKEEIESLQTALRILNGEDI